MGPAQILADSEWLRGFALVDCTSFYASCEKLFTPGLRDRPLIVLSNNDGCVVSRCRLAKSLEIPLGVPVFKIRTLIEKHDITVRSSNYELYGDISRRVMDCLSRFTPQIEVYSIDEAFISLDTAESPFCQWSLSLRRKVRQLTGIDVTVGVGPTKTLAKVASHIAKSNPQTEGVFCLNSRAAITEMLPELPVSELWGIGHRYRKKLASLDITRVQQLLDLGELWLEKHLGGINGRRLWWELHGVPCSDLNPRPAKRQQIAYSRSFSNPVEELLTLEAVLCQYISCAVARMRSHELAAHRMSIFLHTNRHRPNLPQHHPVLHHSFAQASVYTPEFIASGRKLLHAMFRPGHRYIKAGVMLWDLCEHREIPPHLFLPSPKQKLGIMAAIDRVNIRMGRNTLRPASFVRTASWQMRRSKLSPRYTTRWAELPEIRYCLLRETGGQMKVETMKRRVPA